MDLKSRHSRACTHSNMPDDGEFKKVLDLQNSRLIVYTYRPEEFADEKKPTIVKNNDFFVLHNTTQRDLKRPDFINELCQYRTKCIRCKSIILKVRGLLDEISAIKGNEVLTVCMYCKKANPAGKCKRCEYVANKFRDDTLRKDEERKTKFRTWLTRVRAFLESILEEDRTCHTKIHRECSAAELQNLLDELKLPLMSREPDIELLTSADSEAIISQSKELLEELLLSKHKYISKEREEHFLTSTPVSDPRCICKHLRDNMPVEMPPLVEKISEVTRPCLKSPFLLKTPVKNDEEKNKEKSPKNKENVSPKSPRSEKEPKPPKGPKELKPPKEPRTAKEPKHPKVPKANLAPEDILMLKLLKIRKQEKKQMRKPAKKEKPTVLPKIQDLPPLKVQEVVPIKETSDSILECGDQGFDQPTEMIRGKKVVKYGPRNAVSKLSVKPLLFKTHLVCPEPIIDPIPPATTPVVVASSEKLKKYKQVKDSDLQADINSKGIINYQLSNREFIDRGWTQLPITKIMRRMNIYKMVPANPKYDWFKINKDKKNILYDTGEMLANIDPNGCGRWYYKSGAVALDYYNAEELNARQRYVIYSSPDEMDSGKLKPHTVLASFDYLGNGVVYDHYGNTRLKYNQSEGLLLDAKVGPPGRWKWHTLNDPPVLQPTYIDVREGYQSPELENIIKSHKEDIAPQKVVDPNMLSIELDNFLKEKARKLVQQFKHFQIRTKVLKLNDKFSLRIMDQANINLLFRDGPITLKLNLGMLLLNNEIIDTDTIDMADVATPYDIYPPRSNSMANLQSTLQKAKKLR